MRILLLFFYSLLRLNGAPDTGFSAPHFASAGLIKPIAESPVLLTQGGAWTVVSEREGNSSSSGKEDAGLSALPYSISTLVGSLSDISGILYSSLPFQVTKRYLMNCVWRI